MCANEASFGSCFSDARVTLVLFIVSLLIVYAARSARSVVEFVVMSADVMMCCSMMDRLVENGANVNFQNDIGKTA